MAPNRVVIYLTLAVALVAGLVPVVGDLDLTSTAGILAGLGAVLAVVLKWLTGWQNIEKAQIQVELDQRRSAIMQETEAAAIRAANEAGKPGTRKLDLPR
jgi:hypothetical protein